MQALIKAGRQAQDEALVADVRQHWEHWAQHLGLENWWATFEVKPLKDTGFQVEHYDNAYQRVWVKINPKAKEYWPRSRVILHEVAHILLFPLQDYADEHTPKSNHPRTRDLGETITDVFTAIIWRMHEATGCDGAGRKVSVPLGMDNVRPYQDGPGMSQDGPGMSGVTNLRRAEEL